MKNSDTRGFTLIEILIAISLSSIFLLGGMARYVDFNRSQTVKAAAQNVKSNLRDIQGKALAGVKPTTNCNGTLDGYVVQIISNTSYRADAVCGGINSNNPVTYQLPTGTTFESLPASFRFNVLGQGVSAATTLVLKDVQTNKCFGLTISLGGEITETGLTTCAITASPTPTPTPSSSPVPSVTPSPTPSASPTPSPSPSAQPSPSPSVAPTPSPSASPLNLCGTVGGYCSSTTPLGCSSFSLSPCRSPKRCVICF